MKARKNEKRTWKRRGFMVLGTDGLGTGLALPVPLTGWD